MENQFLLKDCAKEEMCVVYRTECQDIKKQKRLCELGLVGGEKIKYIKKNKDGSGLIVLRGAVFSVDNTLASSIVVLRGNLCKK